MPQPKPNPKDSSMPVTIQRTMKMYAANKIRQIAIIIFSLISAPLWAATLLPPGEITFLDNNGRPLASGTVNFYIPGTTTPKTTWRNAAQTIANTNPVVLDAAGRAIIYGNGTYRQIVKDNLGNIIWDQVTSDTSTTNSVSWGGTSTGAPNAQIVNAPNFSNTDGQAINFIAGFTNSSAMTLSNGTAPINVLKDTAAGPTSLTGGEVVAGNLIQVVYSSATGAFHLANYPISSFTTLTVNTLTVTGTATVGGASVFVPGELKMFAMSTCPTGWAETNGSTFSRTGATATLFANIGTTWGTGDGSTTANLPDFRGYFLRSWTNGGTIDPGRAFASTQQDALQGHRHSYNNTINDGFNGSGSGAKLSNSGDFTGGVVTDPSFGTARVASETRPINKAVLYCIKL